MICKCDQTPTIYSKRRTCWLGCGDVFCCRDMFEVHEELQKVTGTSDSRLSPLSPLKPLLRTKPRVPDSCSIIIALRREIKCKVWG
jgi:hypothetical protein